MDFVAIDVETANADMASICQIGIAKFQDGKLADEWVALVNPEDYFSSINESIHGITQNDVKDQPTFPQILDKLSSYLTGTISVCHTHFDRVSLNRAADKYDIPHIDTIWLDSAKVARRTWETSAWKGYGLANICEEIGYEFKHHDALEDAKACGHVLLAAIEKSELSINDWLKRVDKPIAPYNLSISKDGNPEGELYGEVLVFTGSLEIVRSQAADMAAELGCSVTSGVNKKTTLLVVGDQDFFKLAGKDKSAKHLKAEQLIAKGQKIRILKESDFKELVTTAQTKT